MDATESGDGMEPWTDKEDAVGIMQRQWSATSRGESTSPVEGLRSKPGSAAKIRSSSAKRMVHPNLSRPATPSMNSAPETGGDALAADVDEGNENVGEEESGIIKVELTIPTSKDSSRELVGVGTSSADAGLPHEAASSGEEGPEEHNAIVPHPSFASHAELTYDWIVGPVTPDISSTSVLGRQQSFAHQRSRTSMRRSADKPKVRGTGTLFRHSNGPIIAEVDHALCDPAVRRPHQVGANPLDKLELFGLFFSTQTSGLRGGAIPRKAVVRENHSRIASAPNKVAKEWNSILPGMLETPREEYRQPSISRPLRHFSDLAASGRRPITAPHSKASPLLRSVGRGGEAHNMGRPVSAMPRMTDGLGVWGRNTSGFGAGSASPMLDGRAGHLRPSSAPDTAQGARGPQSEGRRGPRERAIWGPERSYGLGTADIQPWGDGDGDSLFEDDDSWESFGLHIGAYPTADRGSRPGTGRSRPATGKMSRPATGRSSRGAANRGIVPAREYFDRPASPGGAQADFIAIDGGDQEIQQ